MNCPLLVVAVDEPAGAAELALTVWVQESYFELAHPINSIKEWLECLKGTILHILNYGISIT